MNKAIKFKKVRTLKDIQNDPRVEQVYFEKESFYQSSGSYWIHLKEDFVSPEMQCHTIHEDTIQRCCQLLNDVITKTEFDKKWYSK